MPPRTLSWLGFPPVIIPSDPPKPARCSEQENNWKTSEFLHHRLSSLLLDVAVDRTSSSSCNDSMCNWWVFKGGGFHLFAKTNGILTPNCYIQAGPTSTCWKYFSLILTWLMIKPFLVCLVLNMSGLNLLTWWCLCPVSKMQPMWLATENATFSCVLCETIKH